MLNEHQRVELLNVFLAESGDLLLRIEQVLTALDEDYGNTDAINELFRAVHTLKGSAGLLGLELVGGFAHVFEDVLMRLRDGEIGLDSALMSLAFKCMDHLAVLVETVAAGENTDPDPERAAQLLEALERFRANVDDDPLPPTGTADLANERPDAQAEGERGWHIALRFCPEFFHHGFDPASFVRYLDKLGEVEDVQLVTEALPATIEEFEPENCYFGLDIRLQTNAAGDEIAEVFEFIADITEIRILPQETEASKTPGEDREPQHPVDPPVANEVAEKHRPRKPAEAAFLRVATNKLDALINQVGELVIAAAGAQLLAGNRNDPELSQMCEDIQHHVEMIRESALQLRMVEIGESFNRFHRVVRETSETLNKKIRLDIQGAETELDKTLVDKIHDPLVHLVRNAIDHGIESPEQRIAANKTPEGHVALNAFYESGMIVIEVADDGRGIDVEKVRAKASDAGVIESSMELDERALLELIFHPGLSTAGEVSTLSGRGVGMDSVRQDIDALRGTVEISNQPGKGCCMRIRLPLTLAIIDGFLVSVADQFFVIPTEWVVECIEAPRGDISAREFACMDLRGKPLPVANLRKRFDIAGPQARRQSLIVVSQGQDRAGLVVDALHGEIQTVIKPLGSLFESLSGIAGGTILGSGKVALTLDVPSLLSSMRDTEFQMVAGGER